jgi:ethanolamine ammonia-lyase small subunit
MNESKETASNKRDDVVTPSDVQASSARASSHAQNAALRGLRDYTSARVALGRAGTSIATTDILDFQLAHAQARDAVNAEFDVDNFARRLRQEVPTLKKFNIPVLSLGSAARDREIYVRRPDLGRVLDQGSADRLSFSGCDVVFVIADGLSAVAPERNSIPLLNAVLPDLFQAGWTCGPVCVVRQARVAIGDQIGSLLGASLSVVLIGERPGLSSHDSLGAYITWQPQSDRTDAERNCISNIRSSGLSHAAAATRLFWYLTEARSRRLAGIGLKGHEGTNYLAR